MLQLLQTTNIKRPHNSWRSIIQPRTITQILIVCLLLFVTVGCTLMDESTTSTDSDTTSQSDTGDTGSAETESEEPESAETESEEPEPTKAPVEEPTPEPEPTEEPVEEASTESTGSNSPGNAGAIETAQAEEPAESTEAESTEPEPTEAESTETDAASETAESAVEYGAAAALSAQERNGMYSQPPPMVIDTAKFYYATFETVQGDIKVQLFADRAPMTVNNFVYLARDGYYNNTTFHRVLEQFMAQAGDPTGTGTGGPGYEFEDEFFPGLEFDRAGILAMANRGPATNGSQIFITFVPTPHLTGRHTIFGEVIEGIEILDKITRRDPGTAATAGDEIYTITIEETDASALPEPTPPPPTPTPLPTPTPYAPSSMDSSTRPLAQLTLAERADLFNVAPEMVIDTSKKYTAVFNTNKGTMRFELDANAAPMAVNNLVVVAELGYFDNAPINQVNPGQFAIAGAIVDESSAQPTIYDLGYDFAAETGTGFVPESGSLAYIPLRQDDSGAILSSGSQLLFALAAPPPQSATQFSFFGQLTEGDTILQQLTAEDVITSVEIEVE